MPTRRLVFDRLVGRWRRAGGASSAMTFRRGADALASALHRHGRDAAAVAAGRVLTVLGGVIGVRVLTESLSPAVFGRYKLALAGLSLVTGVLVRPFIQYAMRAYHDAAAGGGAAGFLAHSRRWFRQYVGWLGLAVATAGYVFAGGGRALSLPELAGVGAVLVLQSLVEYDRALFVTRGRQGAAETISTATQWLIPFAVAALVRLDESLWAILAAHAAALALALSARRRSASRDERDVTAGRGGRNRFETAPAAAFVWPLMVGGGLGWLLHESDRFILGYFRGSAAVGLYAAAYGLVATPFTVAVGAVAQFMSPLVFAASSRRGASPVVSKPMLAGTLAIGAGGVLAIWWSGDRLAAVVLAESYRDGVSVLLLWIAAGYACFGVSACFDLAAHGAKKTTWLMVSCGVAAAANVGLDLLLVPARGAEGAAVATAAALFCYLLCMAALVGVGARRGQAGTGAPARSRSPWRPA